MAKDLINKTVESTTNEVLKSTYRNGNRRGNGMSHPLMDFKCLKLKAVLSIKKKLDKVVANKGATIRYYDQTHVHQRAMEVMETINREGGFNSVIGNADT